MAKEMKFNYGGQAVMEGVMMRGQRIFAVAVRDPDGKVLVHKDTVPAALYRGRVSKTPFLRGVVGLWDSLGLGMRALLWSADVAVGDEASFTGPLAWGTVAFSLLFGIGLFFVLPAAASAGIESLLGLQDASFLANLIEGGVRLTILIGYISLVGLMPDMRRVFAYHGAEHKTINAYEAGAELTPEVVQQYPIEHPRCGTAFLLIVVFVGVLVFSLVPRGNFIILLLSRVALIPVIAGIAYEVLRWTARNLHRPWVRVLIKPNLALQHLTTRQPDLAMLEVAIAAFKHVLVSEGELDEAEVAQYPVTDGKKPAAVPASAAAPVGQ
ncbi:MAG: DUF1385 domain-containing protein [Anaerolineae bacterium]|jgi:uncharacterized protein YqhQ|nr:DUF1385 domain-containing protein [Anaerolineae bacterium]